MVWEEKVITQTENKIYNPMKVYYHQKNILLRYR